MLGKRVFTKTPYVGNNETRAERYWSKDISNPNMGRLSGPLVWASCCHHLHFFSCVYSKSIILENPVNFTYPASSRPLPASLFFADPMGYSPGIWATQVSIGKASTEEMTAWTGFSRHDTWNWFMSFPATLGWDRVSILPPQHSYIRSIQVPQGKYIPASTKRSDCLPFR